MFHSSDVQPAKLVFPTFEAVTVPLLKDPEIKAYFNGQLMGCHTIRQRKLAILDRCDPLFKRVMHMLGDFLDALYPASRRLVLSEFDRNPHAFMELYANIREEAERLEHVLHRRARSAAARKASGSRLMALEALKRKCRDGLAEEGDLLKYLELTDAV